MYIAESALYCYSCILAEFQPLLRIFARVFGEQTIKISVERTELKRDQSSLSKKQISKRLKKFGFGFSVTLFKTKLLEWTGYETSQTTKKITMLLCFMLCARSRLRSFVLGVMLH